MCLKINWSLVLNQVSYKLAFGIIIVGRVVKKICWWLDAFETCLDASSSLTLFLPACPYEIVKQKFRF